MYKKCRAILTLLASLVFTDVTATLPLEQAAEIHHTQERGQLGRSIKESILSARESVLIFTFSLSDPDVIEALNEKGASGVAVTVVIDKEHLAEINGKRGPGVEVVTRSHGEGHLHHKILVVDSEEIWVGSANFTRSSYMNQENVHVRFLSKELGAFLHQEADVFRGTVSRAEHGPLLITLQEQDITFCLLPHDGFPPKRIEKAINDNSKKELVEKIREAKNSIRIAMMVWTNNDLCDEVIQAKRRGVKVQIVAPDLGGNILKLKNAGIEVRVNPRLGFMHNKLMWVDDILLVNGSANWSQSSFTRSDESFVIIEPMTESQQQQFRSYWTYLFGL